MQRIEIDSAELLVSVKPVSSGEARIVNAQLEKRTLKGVIAY